LAWHRGGRGGQGKEGDEKPGDIKQDLLREMKRKKLAGGKKNGVFGGRFMGLGPVFWGEREGPKNQAKALI